MERLSSRSLHVTSALVALGFLLLLACPLSARSNGSDDAASLQAARVEPWPKELRHEFSLLPIMNGGRIKPMRAYADYTMLGMRGIRKMSWTHELPDGGTRTETIDPVSFLLDVLFFPEQASRYPAILVTDSDVLDAVGLRDLTKKKRDRYSFEDLKPGFARLEHKADEILRKREEDRTRIEKQILDLRLEARKLANLLSSFVFARARYELKPEGPVAKSFGNKTEVSFRELFDNGERLHRRLAELTGKEAQLSAAEKEEHDELLRLLRTYHSDTQQACNLLLFPGTKDRERDPTWWTPREILSFVTQHGAPPPKAHDSLLGHWIDMAAHRGDRQKFRASLDSLVVETRELAQARSEYHKIEMEVSYIEADYFYYSKLGFVFAFLFIAFSWLFARARWLWWGAWGFTAISFGYAAWGIVVRCLLRERPPVSTLYETILFITVVCVLLGMATELLQKRRLALPVAAFLGATGMFMAGRYEVSQGVDTMPKLIAVLDTNFWLATHVTTVTIGYAAGLIAGAVGYVYVLGKLFRGWSRRPQMYKELGRMVYGLIAFGLVFAVVGTILGGIWANDSWGRFWGWDPKENGALLICIYMIAMLHARMGGYIRNFGMAICAVLGASVVAFSWWGVNMLGVGLHSYGFTEGAYYLMVFYAVNLGVAILGVYALLRNRSEAEQKRLLERAKAEGRKEARSEIEGGPQII